MDGIRLRTIPTQVRLLEHVLGVADAAQEAIGNGEEVAPLLFEGIRNMFGHSTQAFAQPSQGLLDNAPLPDNSPLMPPDQLASADLAQDDGAADDYNLTSDNSGFDSSNDDI